MSRIRADRYTNRLGTGAPVFSNGVNITGNVGVGTTVPTSKLTVLGDMNVTGTVSVGGTLSYEDVTSIDSVGIITAQAGIRVTGGSVGIGLTNPVEPLHVNGDARVDGNLYLDSTKYLSAGGSGTYWGSVQINGSGGGGYEGYSIDGRAAFVHDGSTTMGLYDDVNDHWVLQHSMQATDSITMLYSGNNTEALRIDSSGRLLVGPTSTSTPSSVVIQGNSTGSTSYGLLRLTKGSTTPADGDALGLVAFGDSNHNTNAQIASKRDGGTWNSGSSHPTRLEFNTTADGASGSTERLRITSEGYLQQHKLIAVSYSDTREIALSNTDLTPSNFYNHTFFESDSNILDSNGHFVAPVHGIYRLFCRFSSDAVTGNRINVRLRKNGTTLNEAYCVNNGGNTNTQSASSEIIAELDVGEYFDLQCLTLETIAGSQHKVVNFHMLG